ncbi:hypothetical protein HPB51_009482 [Rhipicephalus microplus]|uniref:PiggyBac transposable element-derived protein domain-containing protein n=1 Tax=Rhipicephalus microplus TaxID=6941 RepID=A0A9J6DUA5_RHIMP|nr:hypothetical protein HPB51_009482 [Rhipicephalus microplus]
MASSSRIDAPKRRRVSRESSASTVDFEDAISSSESGEDVDSSDFSTDDEDASSQSATSDRVSTFHGHDSLPASVKRAQFLPRRNPGVKVGDALRSDARRFVRVVDFFQLFFTTQAISMICDFTNKYAWMHILERGRRTRKETIMPRSRFFAFLAFLSVMDPEQTDPLYDGKLHRIANLLQHINDVSSQLFQPYRNMCVAERMVKSKGRSGIRQYMRDKGVKWGYKLWVLADSRTGYTVQFGVYIGKREAPSSKQAQQIEVLKGHIEDEIKQHEKLIKQHQDEIERHKKKIRDLKEH